MNKLMNNCINYLWIYLIYLAYTFLFLGVDLISIKQPKEKFLLPLLISLFLYIVIIGMTSLYQQVKDKRYFIYTCSLIFIGVMVELVITGINYKADNILLMILVFCLIPIIVYLIPYLGKRLFHRPFSKIQFYLIIYILAVYLNLYIILTLFSVSGQLDLYYLIFIFSFLFIYPLFSQFTYNRNVLIKLKDVCCQIGKHILTRQFINHLITLIFLVIFIYGVYTISHATQTVRKGTFIEYGVFDTDILKSFILEERIKGGILAAFGGVGLLVKYIFATNHYYKK